MTGMFTIPVIHAQVEYKCLGNFVDSQFAVDMLVIVQYNGGFSLDLLQKST
jgi:hypothetical protein